MFHKITNLYKKASKHIASKEKKSSTNSKDILIDISFSGNELKEEKKATAGITTLKVGSSSLIKSAFTGLFTNSNTVSMLLPFLDKNSLLSYSDINKTTWRAVERALQKSNLTQLEKTKFLTYLKLPRKIAAQSRLIDRLIAEQYSYGCGYLKRSIPNLLRLSAASISCLALITTQNQIDHDEFDKLLTRGRTGRCHNFFSDKYPFKCDDRTSGWLTCYPENSTQLLTDALIEFCNYCTSICSNLHEGNHSTFFVCCSILFYLIFAIVITLYVVKSENFILTAEKEKIYYLFGPIDFNNLTSFQDNIRVLNNIAIKFEFNLNSNDFSHLFTQFHNSLIAKPITLRSKM